MAVRILQNDFYLMHSEEYTNVLPWSGTTQSTGYVMAYFGRTRPPEQQHRETRASGNFRSEPATPSHPLARCKHQCCVPRGDTRTHDHTHTHARTQARTHAHTQTRTPRTHTQRTWKHAGQPVTTGRKYNWPAYATHTQVTMTWVEYEGINRQ